MPALMVFCNWRAVGESGVMARTFCVFSKVGDGRPAGFTRRCQVLLPKRVQTRLGQPFCGGVLYHIEGAPLTLISQRNQR